MCKQGDIVLINIPFSDLKSSKQRPVLIISNDGYNSRQSDVIVAAITSNLSAKSYSLEFDNSDMAEGNIKQKSCIRADKIYTLEKTLIKKKFGALSADTVNKAIDLIYSVLSKPQ